MTKRELLGGAAFCFALAVILFASAKKDRWYASDVLKRICGGFSALLGVILIGVIFFPIEH